MPQIETMCRNAHAVLWNLIGNDLNGEPMVSDTPVPIKVKWNWTRRDVVDPNGAVIAIDADVIVDRVIAVGSEMWYGKMKDMPGTAHVPESGVCVVKVFSEVADINGRNFFRKVLLQRKGDSLNQG